MTMQPTTNTSSEEHTVAKRTRIVGNSAYHGVIQQEMARLGCGMRSAEMSVLRYTIKTLRQQGWTHHQIQAHLQEMWGLKRGAYHVRLRRIRARDVLW